MLFFSLSNPTTFWDIDVQRTKFKIYVEFYDLLEGDVWKYGMNSLEGM
jgi:hypothetical protein